MIDYEMQENLQDYGPQQRTLMGPGKAKEVFSETGGKEEKLRSIVHGYSRLYTCVILK